MSRAVRHAAGALLALLALAACSGAPPRTFAPLDYSYLPPITLDVAQVNVVNSYALDPAEQQLASEDPAPPPATLATELTRRLRPGGAPGAATVTIENAVIDETQGDLVGSMAVRIDLASADGTRTGYTEASVQHTDPAPAGDDQLPTALYTMTKELMDAMNVQLQYQIQANLPAWIVPGVGAAPGLSAAPAPSGGQIEAQPLAPPVTTSTPTSGAPTTPPPSQTLTLPPSQPAEPAVPAPGLAPPQQLVPY